MVFGIQNPLYGLPATISFLSGVEKKKSSSFETLEEFSDALLESHGIPNSRVHSDPDTPPHPAPAEAGSLLLRTLPSSVEEITSLNQ